jgi:hypothetical protein
MTAVEWLIQEHFGGIENCTPHFRNKIEQAKEMEKEQTMDFAMKFMMQDRPIVSFYNETFKSKQDER